MIITQSVVSLSPTRRSRLSSTQCCGDAQCEIYESVKTYYNDAPVVLDTFLPFRPRLTGNRGYFKSVWSWVGSFRVFSLFVCIQKRCVCVLFSITHTITHSHSVKIHNWFSRRKKPNFKGCSTSGGGRSLFFLFSDPSVVILSYRRKPRGPRPSTPPPTPPTTGSFFSIPPMRHGDRSIASVSSMDHRESIFHIRPRKYRNESWQARLGIGARLFVEFLGQACHVYIWGSIGIF